MAHMDVFKVVRELLDVTMLSGNSHSKHQDQKGKITWKEFLLVILLLIVGVVESVPITFIKDAKERGAVCLDGSPPAYYLDQGESDGKNNWLIYLQGGGWCKDKFECKTRSQSNLGSSKNLSLEMVFIGTSFSANRKENPEFYKWNRVYVPYCDGSSFTGNVDAPDTDTNITYRGAKIFNATMEDLLAKGLIYAKNALLTGSSAGGLASMIHCDHFREFLPFTSRVKCFASASYFVHQDNLRGSKGFETFFEGLITLHGSSSVLPSSCTSIMRSSLCMFPQYLLHYVKTPVFIAMSAFDDIQIKYNLFPEDDVCMVCQNCTYDTKKAIQGLRRDLIYTLPKARPSSRGMWITNCIAHNLPYNWNTTLKILHNKIFPELFEDWYFDRNYLQVIDMSDEWKNCSSFGIYPHYNYSHH